jgi:organic hydroperoxide reductase OsmC/OhrA
VAQFAPEFDVDLEDVHADVRATFDSSAKYGLPSRGTAFQQVTVRLTIKSPSPSGQVQKLVAHAEMGCHAAQSLREPVPVSFETRLNGEALGHDPISV